MEEYYFSLSTPATLLRVTFLYGCFSRFLKLYKGYQIVQSIWSLFENSTSMLGEQRILWTGTAVEKFFNLLMLLNLCFYITLSTLFI